MKRLPKMLMITALALAFAACEREQAATSKVVVTEVSTDTGGSAKGDFGPPQGEPIQAILTSPPLVPPATGRKAPAKVIVNLEVRELELEIS